MIAVFDIGKTNKKLVLFDEQYQIVREQSVQFPEISDDDGDPCEDVEKLSRWVRSSLDDLADIDLKAINIAAYGASFVHIDKQGKVVAPLYDYKKPYPPDLSEKFYQTYGGPDRISLETASPVLGSLNSGLQIYRLKYQKPNIFTQVKYSLHLPQYLSWLLTGKTYSDITSIGCHTLLWDFGREAYHDWVNAEDLAELLPPVFSASDVLRVKVKDKTLAVGMGLHDSSSALIPYLALFNEPFVLLSTGTWNISLNPFNKTPLTSGELKKDCLCYLDYKGNPVKASRLFSGNEHELRTKQLADRFHVEPDYFKKVAYRPELLKGKTLPHGQSQINPTDKTYEEFYHELIEDLVSRQIDSTQLVLNKESGVKRIFVDGGFSQNPVFMTLLATAFPEMEVFAASVPHATALGAAVALHTHWNPLPIPDSMIKLVRFAPTDDVIGK